MLTIHNSNCKWIKKAKDCHHLTKKKIRNWQIAVGHAENNEFYNVNSDSTSNQDNPGVYCFPITACLTCFISCLKEVWFKPENMLQEIFLLKCIGICCSHTISYKMNFKVFHNFFNAVDLEPLPVTLSILDLNFFFFGMQDYSYARLQAL